MGKLCLKMTEQEVKVLVGMADNLLKKKRVRLTELFDSSGRFKPSKVQQGDSDPLAYDIEQLSFYFQNYTHEELVRWFKDNMD